MSHLHHWVDCAVPCPYCNVDSERTLRIEAEALLERYFTPEVARLVETARAYAEACRHPGPTIHACEELLRAAHALPPEEKK